MLVRVTDAGNEFPYMSLTGITNLSAQSSNLHPYQANTVPGAGDPGSGKLSWNNANQLIATQLQFSLLDQDGIDVSVFLALLGVNDIVVFQDRNDAANYQTWTVTGATTVVSNQFIQVPASLTAGSWVVPSDHQITLAVSNVGPVGPLGPTGATGPSGQGFVIAAIYATQAALLADTIPDGQFGLVVTSPPGGANDGELWLYMSPGGWVYQTDMSVQGIMGPTGDIGPTGATGPAGQSTSFYPYRANDTPGTGDPGSGKVSWNNANQLIATQIQINHVGQDGVDIDVFLALLEVADTVIIQDKSDSANYQTWTVSGVLQETMR
jgi:hypothetical protein